MSKNRKYIPPPPGWTTSKSPAQAAANPVPVVQPSNEDVARSRVYAIITRVSKLSGVPEHTIQTYAIGGRNTLENSLIRAARQTAMYLCWLAMIPQKIAGAEFHTTSASISAMGTRLARYQHPPEDVIGLINRLRE